MRATSVRTERTRLLLKASNGTAALTMVAAVTRRKLPLFSAPDVGSMIVTFLIEPSKLSLEDATKAGLSHVVRWIVEHGNPIKRPPEFRKARFLLGVEGAAKQGNIELIKAWHLFYSDEESEASKKIYEVAVRNGHIHVLDWLYEGGKLANDAMTKVIIGIPYSRADVICWLHDRFPALKLMISLVNVAGRSDSDSMALLNWVYDRKQHFRICFKAYAASVAATRGNLEMLKWLHARQMGRCCAWTLRVAAEQGHFEVVKWVYTQYQSISVIDPLDQIARNGHYEVLKWVLERANTFPNRGAAEDRRWSCEAISQTARDGHLDVLQLFFQDSGDDGDLLDMAAGCGVLDLAKWLHENGASCSTDAMDEAALNGHQHVVEWLHHNRDEGCTFNAMDGAAFQNHLDVLMWLHHHRSEGCSTVAMDAAAESGFLRIVIWLHANRFEGCTPEAMDFAALNGFLHVVQWLHLHRAEGCTTQAMDSAAGTGDHIMVEWLHSNRQEGCTVKAMDAAATGGYLDMVIWLHTHRSEGCSINAISGAAANGHLKIVIWLYKNKSLSCDEDMLAQAAANGHLSVLKWLHVNHSSLFQHFPSVYVDPCHKGVLLWLAEHYPHRFPCDFRPLFEKPGPLALCVAWTESLPKLIDCDHSVIS